ncbi:hypothetical protein [Curtobacterium sp. MCBA15_007]|uniref:hypothetical protein n=1 Tax=Curtobacterium sp. MCBA15_007 TaxID=1898735 RepID=UPI0011141247|nr:hypothetical protein [Curtobacterium sp. MCBA15_007]
MEHRRKLVMGASAAMAAAIIMGTVTPASAASVKWNMSATGCTQTTVTGTSSKAKLSGSRQYWVKAKTTRTRDICVPGTFRDTTVAVGVPEGDASNSTTGLTTTTGISAGKTGWWYADHGYAGKHKTSH